MHRALSPDARYRFVNVARWSSSADFRAAHATEEVVVEDGVDAGPPALA